MAAYDERTQDDETTDAAAFAEAIEAAWAEGEAGWERLARERGVELDPPSAAQAAAEAPAPAPDSAPGASGAGRWWDAPPWHGRIAADEFRAIVAAYVARYGCYTPDLPAREPEVLRTWLRERESAEPPAPRVAA